MKRLRQVAVFGVCVALLAAGDSGWKAKPVAEWTQADAREILTESPWAKQVVPQLDTSSDGSNRTARYGSMRMGGVGIGGPGIGRRGGGRRQDTGTNPRTGGHSGAAPASLTVRWESALPVQEANLKTSDTSAPSVDEGFYAVAVLGIPSRMLPGDPGALEKQLKHRGQLKREAKKTIHSAAARVVVRDDGGIVLFLFPKNEEITPEDKRVQFATQIGLYKITQTFSLDEMVLSGKLAL